MSYRCWERFNGNPCERGPDHTGMHRAYTATGQQYTWETMPRSRGQIEVTIDFEACDDTRAEHLRRMIEDAVYKYIERFPVTPQWCEKVSIHQLLVDGPEVFRGSDT